MENQRMRIFVQLALPVASSVCRLPLILLLATASMDDDILSRPGLSPLEFSTGVPRSVNFCKKWNTLPLTLLRKVDCLRGAHSAIYANEPDIVRASLYVLEEKSEICQDTVRHQFDTVDIHNVRIMFQGAKDPVPVTSVHNLSSAVVYTRVFAALLSTILWCQAADAENGAITHSDINNVGAVSSSSPSVESILAQQLVRRFRDMSDEELVEVLKQLLQASRLSPQPHSYLDMIPREEMSGADLTSNIAPSAQKGQSKLLLDMGNDSKELGENPLVDAKVEDDTESWASRSVTQSPVQENPKEENSVKGKMMGNDDLTGVMWNEWQKRLKTQALSGSGIASNSESEGITSVVTSWNLQGFWQILQAITAAIGDKTKGLFQQDWSVIGRFWTLYNTISAGALGLLVFLIFLWWGIFAKVNKNSGGSDKIIVDPQNWSRQLLSGFGALSAKIPFFSSHPSIENPIASNRGIAATDTFTRETWLPEMLPLEEKQGEVQSMSSEIEGDSGLGIKDSKEEQMLGGGGVEGRKPARYQVNDEQLLKVGEKGNTIYAPATNTTSKLVRRQVTAPQLPKVGEKGDTIYAPVAKTTSRHVRYQLTGPPLPNDGEKVEIQFSPNLANVASSMGYSRRSKNIRKGDFFSEQTEFGKGWMQAGLDTSGIRDSKNMNMRTDRRPLMISFSDVVAADQVANVTNQEYQHSFGSKKSGDRSNTPGMGSISNRQGNELSYSTRQDAQSNRTPAGGYGTLNGSQMELSTDGQQDMDSFLHSGKLWVRDADGIYVQQLIDCTGHSDSRLHKQVEGTLNSLSSTEDLADKFDMDGKFLGPMCMQIRKKFIHGFDYQEIVLQSKDNEEILEKIVPRKNSRHENISRSLPLQYGQGKERT